jgi:predicted  nucleic acid-binding Zn-ribbon protein
MLFEGIFLWLADKIGGTVVGEKIKRAVPSLNKAKKEVEQARRETAAAQRSLGQADAEIDDLIAEIEYQRELIIYLRGCVDNLESRCAAQGAPVPRDFHGPDPKRKSAAQTMIDKRRTE